MPAEKITTAEIPASTTSELDGKDEILLTGLKSCASHSGHEAACSSTDVGSVSQAHASGMSLGKYISWQQLAACGNDITAEDCRGMTMRELHEMIDGHESGSGAVSKGHHGNGHDSEE
jgi:hypothetical protein